MGSTTLQFNLAKANSALVVAVQETDFQITVYTVTQPEAPAQNQGDLLCWRTSPSEAGPLRKASQHTPSLSLQGGSEALLICHSTESSWCRERWKLSPAKAEWQLSLTDFEEWVLNFEDLGNPALIKEHTAELQLPFTLKPQWQGHSSSKPPKTLAN